MTVDTDPLGFLVQADPRWEVFMEAQALKAARITGEICPEYLKVETYVMDILGDLFDPEIRRGPKDWHPSPKRRRFNQDDVLLTMEAVQDGKLPLYTDLVRDAVYSTLADAAAPKFSDVDWSFNLALNDTTVDGEVDLDLWAPILPEISTVKAGSVILVNIITPFGRIKDTPDGYEITLRGWGAWPTKRLFQLTPRRDWDALEKKLDAEFREIFGRMISRFFERLKTDMDARNILNYADWPEHWRGMLEDHGRVEAARNEMAMLVKGHRL